MTSLPSVSDENLPEFLSGSFLPSPPEIMQKIRKASSDIDQIAKIINKDMGLSASVLKTINSPFYGMKNDIVSIPQAVALLGLDSVMNIVNAHLLLVTLKADDYAADLDDFWQLSNEMADTCVVVANYLNFLAFDDIYLLGLFHNAGIPMMLKQFPEYMDTLEEAYTQADLRITDVENQKHNCNHAVVGYLIAKTWRLPDHIRTIIRDHHNTDFLIDGLAEQNNTNLMTVILKISEHLLKTHQVIGKHENDHEWDKIKMSIIDYLGYSEPDFEELEDFVYETMGIVSA